MQGMIRKGNSVLYRCGRHYGQSHCIRNANLLKILLDRLNPLYAIRDIYRIQTLANDAINHMSLVRTYNVSIKNSTICQCYLIMNG